MAGIAALMRKKRQQNELTLQMSEEHHTYTGGGKELTQTPSKLKRPSAGALKNSVGSKESKEWVQKIKQMETPVKNPPRHQTKDTTKLDDGTFETNTGPSYSAIYVGLILISIGLVITFVGLGEKGFKTLELKLIGPVLCVVGFMCVILKIIQCNFPHLFEFSSICKKSREKKQQQQQQSIDQSEKGLTNGHLKTTTSNKSTPQILSPRVTLHSSRKTPRPRSTIPNYIEDSSDEDDFDPGRSKAHTNHFSSYELQQRENKNEILLNPKSLML